MALITDSDIITPADLAAIDPEVTSLQPTIQGPPLVGPESAIREAADQTCREIASKMQNFSGYLMSPGNSANQIAAVMNVYSTSVSRPRVRTNMVVAEEPDRTKHFIKNYLKYAALHWFFRAQFHRKLEDRFELKMNLYQDEAKRAWQLLESTGLPVVLSPLACPGAIREFRAGTWSSDNLSAGGSGSTETGNQYDVVVTYTGSAYQSWLQPNNSESGPSVTASIQVAAGQVITATITGLNPPNGMMPLVGTADGVYSPMAASGWNVYVALSGETPVLQNSTPIPIGTMSFTLPNAPILTNGLWVGTGQFSDYSFAFVRTLSRA